MLCPKCEAYNPDDSKFCNKCGFNFYETIAFSSEEWGELPDKLTPLLPEPEKPDSDIHPIFIIFIVVGALFFLLGLAIPIF